MREHLPALQVVLPLFGALIAALVRGPVAAWLVTAIVSVASLVISVVLDRRSERSMLSRTPSRVALALVSRASST